MQEYLQQLIHHSQMGYLFPHRVAVAAFRVPNEYQLNKHRPKLVENQHWFKIRGTDHIDRVFYSLAGLLLLADLVATPQAQAFKQALMQHCQGGAMVKAPPNFLYHSPSVSTALYAEPVPQTTFESELTPDDLLTPADPAYELAQYLQPPTSWGVEPGIAPSTTTASEMYQNSQDTAALIFQAQRVASEQIFQAQRLMTQQPKTPDVQVTVNLWRKWNTWVDQQDIFAFSLVAAGMIGMAGFGSWLLVSSAVRHAPDPASHYSPQSYWR
ncbi:hypothetical protein [Trichocoleus sp. FACHB-262]|uniref:hypothetical protein n=1 Tax=Trichocoleus sp. FACHB-262 TaxID=2692869 RepID=UPI0016825C51|nr:hypothetical protein [Trichocoleus sp. FACHB-262]MBD2123275.1 hypothetical protein [Trichocoleus sp. FACHB-262]